MEASVKWVQDDFNRTLAVYMTKTKRTIADAVNTKAFFIARRALLNTPKADKLEIKSALTQNSRVAPYTWLAPILVNYRRGMAGKPGLYGKEMDRAQKELIGARVRSSAFLKSGWLPVIKRLELAVPTKYRRRAAAKDPSAKQVGVPKGGAIPAFEGVTVQAKIENAIGTAGGGHAESHNRALMKYGEPAFLFAFTYETADMREHIEEMMAKDTNDFNLAQRR